MAAAGQIIRATISGQVDGQLVENIFHLREVIDAELDEAIRVSLEILRLALLVVYGNSYASNQTRWKRMTPVPLDEQFVPLTGSTVGAVSASCLPNTVAMVCTLRTGVAGKTHRGRFYQAPIPSNFITVNRLNVDGQTAWNGLAANLLTKYGPTGTDPTLRLGIYSRVIGGDHPMTVAGWQQVQQIVPQPIFGNQRRRRPGVGA